MKRAPEDYRKRKKEALRMFARGKTVKEVADYFKMPTRNVHNWYNEYRAKVEMAEAILKVINSFVRVK